MKQKLFTAFLSVFISFSIYSNELNIDSLVVILESDYNTENVKEIIKSIKSSQDFSNREKMHYASMLHEVTFKHGSDEDIILTESLTGTIYTRLLEYDSARIYHHNALELAKEINDSNLIATQLNNLGATYLHQGNVDEARLNYRQALDISRQRHDKGLHQNQFDSY